MKALLVNASPRKNWNTAQLLDAFAEGAREEGAETETVHLYDLSFAGCRSCLACKLKNTKFRGRCAVRDGLSPVLEKAVAADVIAMGSPIYFSYPTGTLRSFLERLLFPQDTYLVDGEGKRVKILDRTIPCAMIYTMNCPESYLPVVHYREIMEPNHAEVERLFGHCETLWCCDTLQVADYSRYDMNMFPEAAKRAHRDEQFPKDLAAARDLGRRLVRLAAATH